MGAQAPSLLLGQRRDRGQREGHQERDRVPVHQTDREDVQHAGEITARIISAQPVPLTQTPFQFTIRKPSRELTYIEEEEEEKLPEIKVVTNTRASRIQEAETEDKNNADDAVEKLTEDLGDESKAETKAHTVTIVNLEHSTDTEGERGAGSKDQDRHVRFTSKVEEIDFKELDEVNEKTS